MDLLQEQVWTGAGGEGGRLVLHHGAAGPGPALAHRLGEFADQSRVFPKGNFIPASCGTLPT